MSALRRLVELLAVLGVLAYGGAALVTVADVVGRRLGMPVEGVVDLVQLCVVTGAWPVMPYAFLAATHVSVDFLVERLPPALVVALRIFAAAVAFVLMALIAKTGWDTFTVRTMFGDRSQQLGIPIAWYWYPLLAGSVLSLVGIALQFGRSLGSGGVAADG